MNTHGLCVHFVSYRIKSHLISQAFSTFWKSHSCGLYFAKLLSELHLDAFCSHFKELTLNQEVVGSIPTALTNPFGMNNAEVGSDEGLLLDVTQTSV